jgi:hypothetical protein
MINASELRRVMAHIEAHQDRWWQGAWRIDLDKLTVGARDEEGRELATCGTAFCFAGWKAELDGVRWGRGDDMPYGYALDETVILPDGRETDAAAYAMETLGLDLAQAKRLFSPGNTLDDLRRIVANLCAATEGEAS